MRVPVFVLVAGLVALPLVAADTCLPACEVVTVSEFAVSFVPALAVVQSGSTMWWSTADGLPHTATDRVGSCFHTAFTRDDPGQALFFVADGVLWGVGENGEAEPCLSATGSADGAFVLDYVCLIHPQMRAKLVVR